MKRTAAYIIMALLALLLLAGCGSMISAEDGETAETTGGTAGEEINLRDIYGGGYQYLFTYKGEDYTAIYSYDNWSVYVSYKITSRGPMKKIIQAL